jgi:hypothetical protein
MVGFSDAREWDLDIDRYLNRIIPPSPLHKLPTPVSRFLGYRKETRQDVGNILGAFWSLLGAFCGLAVVAAVFNNTDSIQWHHPPALIASFVRCRWSVQCVVCCADRRSRVLLQFLSTTPYAHHSVNPAMPCWVTVSLHLSVSVYRSCFNITQTTTRYDGSQAP